MVMPTTGKLVGKTIGGVPVHNVALSLLMAQKSAVPVQGGGSLAIGR